ncbi:TIGR02206 family membrane protein [Virgibacillus doumboii]|uniref:YwaF family protein n=1 Tax=Virgibacillus doumboii TaxID=2697503 RepID=UPI0013E09DC7|nr:TIGR02206 family membrane protein [Virgibacillus doumboii]
MESTVKFEHWGMTHFAPILILIIGVILIVAFRESIRNFKYEPYIRKFSFVTMVGLELIFQMRNIYLGPWTIQENLPFHLCNISAYLCIYLLLTNDKRVFPFIYFCGIIPAFLAILTPDLDYIFPHFNYFKYFITHMMIVWVGLYYLCIRKYVITTKSTIYTFAALCVIAVMMYILNTLTGSNYLYISGTPDSTTPLSYLGDFPWYIINLFIIAITVFTLLASIFFKINKHKKDLQENEIHLKEKA